MSAPTSQTPAFAQSGSRTSRGIQSLLKDAAISFVVDVIYNGMIKGAAPEIGVMLKNRFKKTIEDSRARLMGDLLIMPANRTNKLWKWHADVIAKDGNENRFVSLLCKLTDGMDKDSRKRQALLAEVNALSPKKFEQALCLLENDVLRQYAERLFRKATGGAKWTMVEAKIQIPRIANEINQLIGAEVTRLNDAAKVATPHLQQFADRMEASTGKRDRLDDLLLGWRRQLEVRTNAKKGERP
jgi:hypothetical protein